MNRYVTCAHSFGAEAGFEDRMGDQGDGFMFVKAVSLFCKTHQNVMQAEPRSISSGFFVSFFCTLASVHSVSAAQQLSWFVVEVFYVFDRSGFVVVALNTCSWGTSLLSIDLFLYTPVVFNACVF